MQLFANRFNCDYFCSNITLIMANKFNSWIEAVRLRTIPVSVSGVLTSIGYAFLSNSIDYLPALLCLLFAVLAQIASNFANEYYDFKRGFDKIGRVGPRRSVTEGDIKPSAMKNATFITLAAACAVGLALTYWGGLWLIPIGILIAIGVLAYSTGPYPLSHHCLGEVAVLLFFGIVPVNLTYYLQSLSWSRDVVMASVAIGLMGANVLIVNNYRDIFDDKAVGKKTLSVVLGRKSSRWIYLFNGLAAIALVLPVWLAGNHFWLIIPMTYIIVHTILFVRISRLSGSALNKMLGMTALLMFFYALGFLAMSIQTNYNHFIQ